MKTHKQMQTSKCHGNICTVRLLVAMTTYPASKKPFRKGRPLSVIPVPGIPCIAVKRSGSGSKGRWFQSPLRKEGMVEPYWGCFLLSTPFWMPSTWNGTTHI